MRDLDAHLAAIWAGYAASSGCGRCAAGVSAALRTVTVVCPVVLGAGRLRQNHALNRAISHNATCAGGRRRTARIGSTLRAVAVVRTVVLGTGRLRQNDTVGAE